MKRLSFYRSTLGKKVIVALTGAVMLAFLIGHVLGNLKVFLPSPEPGVADVDLYAEFLRSAGEPLLPHGGALWMVRLTLLVALAFHVVLTLQLSAGNRKARPVRYEATRTVAVTRSARWMMVSGLLLLGFVVLHVLHFTTGTIDPEGFEGGAVYANLHNAFDAWPFVAAYVVAMAFVALHLFHGAWSMFQTLGLDNPDRNRAFRWLAVILSVGLFAGFVAVPISFAVGALDAPPGQVSEQLGGD